MAQDAGRPRTQRAALERALLVWPIAVAVSGAAWLVSFTIAGTHDPALSLYGAAAALALSVAVAAVAYHAARAARDRAALAAMEADGARLEHRLQELVDGPLPALVARLREGRSPEAALADFPAVHDRLLGHLVRIVVEAVDAAERETARAQAAAAALESEAGWLADTAIPHAAERIRRDRASAPTVLAELPDPALDPMRRVLHRFAEDLWNTRRTGAAALVACASAAARMQARTTRMLADLRELQERYDEEEVFDDLLVLDHAASQMGRLADSIAMLSGGRSGRRWTKPIVMESILRGAMGRIADFRRVRYHSTSSAAVAGFAAEGVMHVLAELMDNAANFSPYGSMVHVYVEEEDSGVVVTIEDAGLGMRLRERRRAERLVSEEPDLTSIPGTRLGLAVVGRLAHKYDLRISFRPSSRGGIGAVVLIPAQLITHLPEDVLIAASMPGLDKARRPAAVAPRGAGQTTTGVADGSGGLSLPKRRRGATLVSKPEGRPAPGGPPSRDAGGGQVGSRDGGSRFAAFRQSARPSGTAAGGDPPAPGSPASEPES